MCEYRPLRFSNTDLRVISAYFKSCPNMGFVDLPPGQNDPLDLNTMWTSQKYRKAKANKSEKHGILDFVHSGGKTYSHIILLVRSLDIKIRLDPIENQRNTKKT